MDAEETTPVVEHHLAGDLHLGGRASGAGFGHADQGRDREGHPGWSGNKDWPHQPSGKWRNILPCVQAPCACLACPSLVLAAESRFRHVECTPLSRSFSRQRVDP